MEQCPYCKQEVWSNALHCVTCPEVLKLAEMEISPEESQAMKDLEKGFQNLMEKTKREEGKKTR